MDRDKPKKEPFFDGTKYTESMNALGGHQQPVERESTHKTDRSR